MTDAAAVRGVGSLPRAPTRPLVPDTAAALIRASFPSVRTDGLTHLGAGWHFDVFLTVDGWVFRFPRPAVSADVFDVERRLHALVAGTLLYRVLAPKR